MMGKLGAELKEECTKMEKAYKVDKKARDAIASQLEASRKEFQSFEREDIKHREDIKFLKAQGKKLEVLSLGGLKGVVGDVNKMKGGAREVREKE